MSYHISLLKAISEDLKKPMSDFQPFVQALESNWYTTQEAINTIPDEEFYRMGFPGQLVVKIKEKIGRSNNVQQQQPQQQNYQAQSNQQYKQPQTQYPQSSSNQGQNPNQRQPIQQVPNQQQYKQQMPPSNVKTLLSQARSRLGQQQFLLCGQTLLKIFVNIQNNVGEQKYRTIKKGNTLGRIYKHQEFVAILKEGGFQDQGTQIRMNSPNVSHLNAIVAEIDANTQPKFDPYKATICSLTSTDKINMAQSSQYPELLEQLKKERIRLMSLPIKNRDIKIYKFKSEENMNQNAQGFKEAQENPNEDQKFFLQQLKQNLKKLEEGEKFMSKRKTQYVDLLKKPCFSELVARVKCPNNTVFECKFSPMEKLATLVLYFKEYLVNKNLPFYLYMTPPVRKIEGELAEKTFFSEDCMPRATFYFGSDLDTGTQEILKDPKAGYKYM